jgi:hypothetical protein
MKFNPKVSLITAWVLTVALSVSPLMAQNPPAPEVKPVAPQSGETSSAGEQNDECDSPTPVLAEEGTPPGTSAHVASPGSAPEATFPTVAKRSTVPTSAASAPSAPPRRGSNSPGESKWVILAALVAAGATVAAILLFRGFGGNGDDESEDRVGTVISAGPPSVNTPNR